MDQKNKVETVVFGAGCFWCAEAVFSRLKGVLSAVPGYAGGTKTDPGYEQVCAGNTGHAEVVRIEYDPEKIGFDDLLAVFFATHDATAVNRQGNDIGTQYRSAIFYSDEKQKAEALAFIEKLGPGIATELKPLEKFYPAEDYHRDYYKNNSRAPYCQAVIDPKLDKFKDKFQSLLKT